MTNAERKRRNPRTTALTCGLMAEIALGTALLIWSTSPSATARTVFGPGVSIAAVTTAMVALAAGMLVLVLAPRLGRKVLLATVSIVSLVAAWVGVIAVTTLLTEPGIGLLLGFGWVLTMPVTLAITRAGAASSHP